MPTRLDVSWEALAWEGLEHCCVTSHGNRYVVSSRLIGEIDSIPFKLKYQLEIDEKWRITSVIMSSNSENTKLVEIHSDTQGNWFGADQQVLPEFSGCLDIDISLSPFTNTLPIRRLTFEPQIPQAIDVVWIDPSGGQLKRMRQWYTLLERNHYRYEDENGYSNIITVDENGLVVDYPRLFKLKAG